MAGDLFGVDGLLERIGVEVRERMDVLRPAVDEHERLQADLRALQAEHGQEEPMTAGVEIDVEIDGGERPADGGGIPADSMVRECEPASAKPLVSSKVLRLMGPPRQAPGRGRRAGALSPLCSAAEEVEVGTVRGG